MKTYSPKLRTDILIAVLALLTLFLLSTGGCRPSHPARKQARTQGRQLWIRNGDNTWIDQVVTDGHDNIYISGFESLTKYDSAGHIQWTKNKGHVSLDKDDNVYTYGEDTLRKFSPDGHLVWEVKEPGLLASGTVDGAGNRFQLVVNSNPRPPFQPLETQLFKLGGDGRQLWAAQVVPVPRSALLGSVVDDNGNVYLFYHPSVANDREGPGVIVTKFTKEGGKEYTIEEGEYHNDPYVNPRTGFLYFMGGVGRTARAFNVTAYDPSGRKIWTKRVHGPESLQAVTGDSAGNIYVAGSAARDLRVTKVSSDGIERWTRDYPLKSPALVFVNHTNGMLVDRHGDIDVATTYGTGTSADGRRYKFGAVKIAPDGRLRWLASIGPYDLIESEAGTIPVLLATDNGGNIVISTGPFIAKFGPPDRR